MTLFAQRIMPLHSQDEVGGYELLLRSLDPPQENHAPAALLAAALRSGLAPELDLWVIDHAIGAARPYLPELLASNVSLSINLAGPSLTDDGFLERLRTLITRSGLPPGLILFEVTETVALLSLTKAVKFIRELRAMGCRFALDDFGTGANSLKNLTNLPVDRVKIDGSFVSDILTNPQSAAIVRAMVTLARDLGINTVAEYAETEQIIQRLTELGVEHAQGYAIEKPRALALVLAELRHPRQNRQHPELGAARCRHAEGSRAGCCTASICKYTAEHNGLSTVRTTMLTQDTSAAREPWETVHTVPLPVPATAQQCLSHGTFQDVRRRSVTSMGTPSRPRRIFLQLLLGLAALPLIQAVPAQTLVVIVNPAIGRTAPESPRGAGHFSGPLSQLPLGSLGAAHRSGCQLGRAQSVLPAAGAQRRLRHGLVLGAAHVFRKNLAPLRRTRRAAPPSTSWRTIRTPSRTWTARRLTSVFGSRLKLLPDRWAQWLDTHVRGSIVTRTTLAILGPAMILGLTFASFVSGSVERSEQQRAQVRLQQLLSTVERTAQIACYLKDRTLADEIAHGLISNHSVSRVTITSGTRYALPGRQP